MIRHHMRDAADKYAMELVFTMYLHGLSVYIIQLGYILNLAFIFRLRGLNDFS